MQKPEERISVLEAFRVTDSMDVAELKKLVERIDSNVQTIQNQLHKQQGFTTGVMFVLAPIWAAILYLAKDIYQKVTGG